MAGFDISGVEPSGSATTVFSPNNSLSFPAALWSSPSCNIAYMLACVFDCHFSASILLLQTSGGSQKRSTL
jgi:hypothetical protein